MAAVAKPHVVCVPFPMQGHIIPMLKLAKLLHHEGFHVTFVNTVHNHNRVLDSRGPHALDGLPDFRFETIPLDQPPSNPNTSLALSLLALREACRKSFLGPFRDLIGKLNGSGSCPPVSGILSDAILSYSLGVSEELGIPNVLLWNMGASGFLSFKHSRDQIKQCLALLKDPSKEADTDMDAVMEWIPGAKGAKLKDLPKFFQTRDRNSSMADSGEGDLARAAKASAVIFHTFDALEADTLRDLSSMFRKVYSIGPLQLLLNRIPHQDRYASLECNLWNEEPECVKWLDSKEPNSVIYMNFGSTTVMTMEQVVELAWGLAGSQCNFLWITRPDMIMGDSAVLPPEFITETKGRGLVASWCPQEEVLNHASVGGFVTHSGWNSTVEAISAGVPLICWPFFGEHFANCRKSCNEWRIGMELKDGFRREDVMKLIEDLFEGEKGKEMKERVMEWKKMAQETTSSAGSSSMNLQSLVNEVLLNHHNN